MRARKVLEKVIEGAVIRYAKKKCPNVEIVKLNGMGKRSHPARMFLFPTGVVLFIEFKREGEEPTPLQTHLHKKWRALGHVVYVIDTVNDGKRRIDYTMTQSRRDDLSYPVPK